MTRQIEINDGVITYSGLLRGRWTDEQIISAFLEGYDTGRDGQGEFICTVWEDGVKLFSFTAQCDGKGGIVRDNDCVTPHFVDWVG